MILACQQEHRILFLSNILRWSWIIWVTPIGPLREVLLHFQYELKYSKEEPTVFVPLEILSVMLLLVFGSTVAFITSMKSMYFVSAFICFQFSSFGYFLAFICNK